VRPNLLKYSELCFVSFTNCSTSACLHWRPTMRLQVLFGEAAIVLVMAVPAGDFDACDCTGGVWAQK